jgi:hypothetical protein
MGIDPLGPPQPTQTPAPPTKEKEKIVINEEGKNVGSTRSNTDVTANLSGTNGTNFDLHAGATDEPNSLHVNISPGWGIQQADTNAIGIHSAADDVDVTLETAAFSNDEDLRASVSVYHSDVTLDDFDAGKGNIDLRIGFNVSNVTTNDVIRQGSGGNTFTYLGGESFGNRIHLDGGDGSDRATIYGNFDAELPNEQSSISFVDEDGDRLTLDNYEAIEVQSEDGTITNYYLNEDGGYDIEVTHVDDVFTIEEETCPPPRETIPEESLEEPTEEEHLEEPPLPPVDNQQRRRNGIQEE